MEVNDKFYQQFSIDMSELGLVFHRPKLDAIIKHLGPSIHNADAALVACSDEKETNYIKKEFLIGKLGLDANDERLDGAISQVCSQLGQSNRHKSRITFYYLLMVILNVEYTALS
jgi:hypothetical protein